MRVRYTRVAAAELSEILDYVAERSPGGARKVMARVVELEALLADVPGAGRRTRLAWLRRIAVSPFPYILQYEITEDAIVIHNVRHAARTPSLPERG